MLLEILFTELRHDKNLKSFLGDIVKKVNATIEIRNEEDKIVITGGSKDIKDTLTIFYRNI